jgi:hypothetical protein
MVIFQTFDFFFKGLSTHFVVPYSMFLPQGLITTQREGEFKYNIIMCKIFGGRIGP